VLSKFGVPFEVLDQKGCIAVEPALALVEQKFVGGLRLPGDETGDCYIFTRKLAEIAASASVSFRWGETILEILHDGRKVTGVRTGTGRIDADAVVVALGSYSPAMIRPFGLKLPVFPIKGYSLTIPIENEAGAPVSTVMDETYKIAI